MLTLFFLTYFTVENETGTRPEMLDSKVPKSMFSTVLFFILLATACYAPEKAVLLLMAMVVVDPILLMVAFGEDLPLEGDVDVDHNSDAPNTSFQTQIQSHFPLLTYVALWAANQVANQASFLMPLLQVIDSFLWLWFVDPNDDCLSKSGVDNIDDDHLPKAEELSPQKPRRLLPYKAATVPMLMWAGYFVNTRYPAEIIDLLERVVAMAKTTKDNINLYPLTVLLFMLTVVPETLTLTLKVLSFFWRLLFCIWCVLHDMEVTDIDIDDVEPKSECSTMSLSTQPAERTPWSWRVPSSTVYLMAGMLLLLPVLGYHL